MSFSVGRAHDKSTYRRPVGCDEERAVLLCADDEVVAVGPRVAARDGVGEVGQHARRLPRLLRLLPAEAAAAVGGEVEVRNEEYSRNLNSIFNYSTV